MPKTIIEQVALLCSPGASRRFLKGLAGALSPQRQRKHTMVLRFRRHGREHGQEAEDEPQTASPKPEEGSETSQELESAEGSDTNEPTHAWADEAPVVGDEPPPAEGADAGSMETPAAFDELPPAESTRATGGEEAPTEPAGETPPASPKHASSDTLSLLNALLRLHGAEDIDSLADAGDQLARTYLNGTHLLVLVADRGGSFHLRAVKSGATATLLEQLSDTLGIDVGRESPLPRQGRMAKIWLDDTASPQAASLADFWGGLAGEETCWRAEKVLGISQVSAIRLASPEEPLGIALFLSQGDPPELPMLDAIGRHLTVALASLLSIEKARQFGTVDPVRWIPDHSEFTRQLSRETSRGHRYDQPVSLALLVVDNFETLRLEYGWTVANRLLRSVSSALAGCLRESDFLGSYRHNGFGVILMQTSVEGAAEAASRLREAATAVRALEGEDSPVPECVVATASCPEDGDDAGALLVAAESRLLVKRPHSPASI
jgi:diguanylate cyclase (GGDEF)-like protein